MGSLARSAHLDARPHVGAEPARDLFRRPHTGVDLDELDVHCRRATQHELAVVELRVMEGAQRDELGRVMAADAGAALHVMDGDVPRRAAPRHAAPVMVAQEHHPPYRR